MALIDFSSSEVQAAVISGGFGVLSALIAAIAAAVIGKKIAHSQKLEDNFQIALEDIAFLLEVEKLYIAHNEQNREIPGPRTIRTQTEKSGLKWSGKLTPGRARYNGLLR